MSCKIDTSKGTREKSEWNKKHIINGSILSDYLKGRGLSNRNGYLNKTTAAILAGVNNKTFERYLKNSPGISVEKYNLIDFLLWELESQGAEKPYSPEACKRIYQDKAEVFTSFNEIEDRRFDYMSMLKSFEAGIVR